MISNALDNLHQSWHKQNIVSSYRFSNDKLFVGDGNMVNKFLMPGLSFCVADAESATFVSHWPSMLPDVALAAWLVLFWDVKPSADSISGSGTMLLF